MSHIEFLEPRRLLASSAIRIEVGGVGGGAYTDSAGFRWSADSFYSGGTARSDTFAVANTESDRLYATRRFGNFSYKIPAPAGSYSLKLFFADPSFNAAGKRKFNVFAEGKAILSNFDIAAAAGGGKKAVAKIFTVSISDGALNLDFRNVLENAIVSGIALEPVPTPSPPPPSAQLSWTAREGIDLPRFEAMSAPGLNKLYLFGGFYNSAIQATKRADVFDLASNAWTRLADVPEALTHAGCATDSAETIYLAGGFVGDWKGVNTPITDHVWTYNITTKKWSAGPKLPAPRAAGALVRVGRVLHFFGGIKPGIADASEHWTYNLDAKDGWKSAPAMPNARNHFGYAAIGTKIYAIGGQHKLDEAHPETAVSAYDTVTRTWSAKKSLSVPRSHTHNATFVRDSRIVMIGGATTGDRDLSDVVEYDPASDSWRTLGNLPASRTAAAAELVSNNMVVATGATQVINPTATTWTSP